MTIDSAWRHPRKASTLPEVYRSIAVPRTASVARKMFAFAMIVTLHYGASGTA